MNISEQIERIRKEFPKNIMAKTFDVSRFNSLSTSEQAHVLKIIKSGLEHPDSKVGAYAMSPDDYQKYGWVLDPIVQTYHGVDENFRQQSSWDLQGDFDLKQIDPTLKDVSMCVRVARNTTEFPLPGSMTKEDRVRFEGRMAEIFAKMIDNPEFGGKYSSLTPGSQYEISPEEYKALVDAHKMFKDMSVDEFLKSAGISADWPYGRGMYESADGKLIVWVNEEDQLRVVSMAKGSDLSEVFKNLRKLLDAIEESGLTFATSEKFGNVTSCPSNIGTVMRASVHLLLPKLVKVEEKLLAIADKNGLSVRGADGEHSGYGLDGLADISPRARMGVTESQILRSLYNGVTEMLKAEKAA
jgi:creatine kinase